MALPPAFDQIGHILSRPSMPRRQGALAVNGRAITTQRKQLCPMSTTLQSRNSLALDITRHSFFDLQSSWKHLEFCTVAISIKQQRLEGNSWLKLVPADNSLADGREWNDRKGLERHRH